jgi:predicted Rossmann fold flavoprotein
VQYEEFDLIIVGAGPSGLFCAINTCNKDKKILLLEKKRSPGRKLLISGSGHCNITHDGDVRSFLDHYGDHGRFLRPAILSFSNLDLISFFDGMGLAMIQEKDGKIFPETLRSKDVLDVLLKECSLRNIDLRCGQEVKSLTRCEDGFEVISKEQIYRSPLLVIATGGRSYPATGSTGNGYRFTKALGHSIIEIGPALTPVFIKDFPFSELAGISFPDMEIMLFRNKKIKSTQGDILFTHKGLSGPGILDLSRDIRAGDTLKLAFLKADRRKDLEEWLLERIEVDGARKLRSVLKDLDLPARLMARILELSKIPNDLGCAHLTRTMRANLIDNLTGFPMVVSELGGFDIAMVTRGGVDLREVNSKTMESKLVKGLYLVGEVLDVDGDTGGYNLQAAFSTAMIAAKSICKSWIET